MKKPKQIYLTETELAFLDRMKEEKEWTHSYTLHQAIDMFMAKHTPSITTQTKVTAVAIQNKRNEILNKTGILPTLKSMKAEQRGIILCTNLEGTIVGEDRLPDPNGGYCLYSNYQCHTSDTRILSLRNPLEYLTADMVDGQYSPDKESYLAFCKDNSLDPKKL